MKANAKTNPLKNVFSKVKKINTYLLSLFMMLTISDKAFALHGGFSTVTSDTSNLQKWLYSLVGIIALGYLTFIGLKIKASKATWTDFGVGLLHVAVAGGAVTAGTYFYKVFA